MTEMQEVPKEDSMKIAWEKYKLTDEYANSFKWAEDKKHRNGSMWAAYTHGFTDAKRHEEEEEEK